MDYIACIHDGFWWVEIAEDVSELDIKVRFKDLDVKVRFKDLVLKKISSWLTKKINYT